MTKKYFVRNTSWQRNILFSSKTLNQTFATYIWVKTLHLIKLISILTTLLSKTKIRNLCNVFFYFLPKALYYSRMVKGFLHHKNLLLLCFYQCLKLMTILFSLSELQTKGHISVQACSRYCTSTAPLAGRRVLPGLGTHRHRSRVPHSAKSYYT